MNAEGEPVEFDVGQRVILNALLDLHSDETRLLVADSEKHLRKAVEEVTTPEERSALSEVFEELLGLERGESADFPPDLYGYVRNVTESLAAEEYSLSVTHEYHQEIRLIDAHTYSFLQDLDVERLRPLDLDSTVRDAIAQGVDQLEAGSEAEACEEFSDAVYRASDVTDKVVARTVAGLGYFRAGDDETALEYVEKALEIDENSLAAKIVGASVKKNENEGDTIRTGQKSVGMILRWHATEPENTSVRADIGTLSDDGDLTWSEIEHHNGHAYLPQLYPDTWLRFELEGELPAFPELHMYYLGIGLFESGIDHVEKVYQELGSGPHRTDTAERVSIYAPTDRP